MGRNKAVGPDQIPIEAWRCLGDDGVRWLTCLFNKTLRSSKMPMEWRVSETIPIYKNKGDAQTCGNYRGIKLLSYTMKLWERVIETRLRRVTNVSENQFGFMPGRSSIEAIHIIRNLMEKYREKQKNLEMVFLDLEKAYDCGRIDEDVSHRIKVGWMKWRAATGVLCDKKVPLKLKGKFYKVEIRPAMLYGSECWPLTKAQERRMEVAEMRMLRWTCGKTMLDMIPNSVFRENLKVRSIIDKLREERLRWFGHVRRRPPTVPIRRIEALTVDSVRRRGRPTRRWDDRIKLDLKELLLTEDMTYDRLTWRIRIRIDE
ncbi:uncharacterized protein [Rutidosis leptorrhynchoides]|uniref:uncharacterized protein n=1 Tax=Rutidosis leptorrhynchoides TaxID=125765 RepID=UPI003A9A2A4C